MAWVLVQAWYSQCTWQLPSVSSLGVPEKSVVQNRTVVPVSLHQSLLRCPQQTRTLPVLHHIYLYMVVVQRPSEGAYLPQIFPSPRYLGSAPCRPFPNIPGILIVLHAKSGHSFCPQKIGYDMYRRRDTELPQMCHIRRLK
ncbi:hypothetical protein DFP72DRAFT_73827 [Ephemerocybe angulata]|uniref:Uncharacterized protein n=1 Tax=Ephemerocybe angulata TaxID=980116 RepID=A0A8H6MCW0_9AGAR|nr:hypothetical protein DFP72DRAFT_73827 [Tulosesus angulatus]